MMRKVMTAAAGSLMLAGCGGGSGGSASSGGSTPVAVVPAPTATATPTPAPTATATPAATPTTTPVPTAVPSGSSYQRYVDLAGEQTFRTACASLVLAAGLPTPQPTTSFGDGLTLGRTLAGDWTVGGDGVSLSFAAGDAVSAPAGQRILERNTGQRLVVTDPVAAGMTLDYTRSLDLRTERTGGTTYSCVFGVPALAVDVPTAVAVVYSRVSVTGIAYVQNEAGAVQSYALAGSTGTVSYDATARAMVVRLHLLGNLQTASGIAAASTDLGTFTGNAAVDATRGRFSGQIDSADRISLFSSFSGAFFGNTEAGAAFEILAADAGTGNRMALVGTIAAAR